MEDDWIAKTDLHFASGNPCANCGRATRESVFEDGVPGILAPGEAVTVHIDTNVAWCYKIMEDDEDES